MLHERYPVPRAPASGSLGHASVARRRTPRALTQGAGAFYGLAPTLVSLRMRPTVDARLPAAPAAPAALAFLLAASLVIATAACHGAGSGSRVVIGVAVNPTGSQTTTISRGVQIAIDALNVERRGRGAPFEMLLPPKGLRTAVELATFLRDTPSVVGVVGHTDSGGTLDASSVYADDEDGGDHAVAAVSPTATSPALSGRSPWLFRVCPSDVAASRAAARYVLDSLGARHAAIIYRNDSYGRDWARAFAGEYGAGGGAIVERDPYLAGMGGWDAYAGYLQKLGADVVLFPGNAEDAGALVDAMRAIGSHMPMLGGDAVSGLEDDGAKYAGVHFTTFFDAGRVRSAEGKAFVAAYQNKYGDLPDQRAALAYDAALVIGRAVLAVGPDRAKVRDWLAGVGTAHPAIRGATGPIAFDVRHDVVNKPVMIGTVAP